MSTLHDAHQCSEAIALVVPNSASVVRSLTTRELKTGEWHPQFRTHAIFPAQVCIYHQRVLI